VKVRWLIWPKRRLPADSEQRRTEKKETSTESWKQILQRAEAKLVKPAVKTATKKPVKQRKIRKTSKRPLF
jgi:hypothetical protein